MNVLLILRLSSFNRWLYFNNWLISATELVPAMEKPTRPRFAAKLCRQITQMDPAIDIGSDLNLRHTNNRQSTKVKIFPLGEALA